MSAPVRQIRAEIRTARLGHRPPHKGTRGDNIYMIALGAVIYGGILVQAVRRMIASPPTGPELPNLPVAQWLLVGCALLGLGLLIRAALVVGPVVAGSPFQFWLLSTPLDRKALLAPRFRWTVIVGTVVGALAGLGAAALLRADLDGKLLSTVAGASLALAVLAGGVLLQARAEGTVLGHRISAALLAVGVLVVAGTVATTPPVLDLPLLVLGPVAVVAGGYVLVRSYSALGELDRAALARGAEIVSATQVSMTWLDISFFTDLAKIRKWRRIGRVRSRGQRGTHYRAMVSAELTRLRRTRAPLLVWAGLLLAPYAAARVLPEVFVPTVQLVIGTVATSPFAGGFRSVCGSPALRRSLGGTDAGQRLVHLAVPAAMALAWTILTLPAVAVTHWPAMAISPIAAVAFVYRRATQPPMDYEQSAVDSPFGLLPTNTFRQLARGPLLLLILAGLQLNL
jgi:hypothetical protein